MFLNGFFFLYIFTHLIENPPPCSQKADTNNSLIMIPLWFQLIQSLKPTSFKCINVIYQKEGDFFGKRVKHERKVMGYSKLVKCLVQMCAEHFLKHIPNTQTGRTFKSNIKCLLCVSDNVVHLIRFSVIPG